MKSKLNNINSEIDGLKSLSEALRIAIATENEFAQEKVLHYLKQRVRILKQYVDEYKQI